MRRGIHLRQLRNRDLTVLGVAAGRVPEPEALAGHPSLLEVDPALGRRVEALCSPPQKKTARGGVLPP